MLIRRGVFPCIQAKTYGCRLLSRSSVRTNDDRQSLPSRKLFMELTETTYFEHKLVQSGRRSFKALIEKPIVVKNFFVSDLDPEGVQYPKLVSKKDSDKWKKAKAKVGTYFENGVEFNEHGISQSVHNSFKEMHLYGYNIPKEYGGQEYNYTQQTHASEIETLNIQVAMLLNAHRLVCETINESGMDEQRAKYLPKLATGELIGTLAFEEWNEDSKIGLNTEAEYDDDDEQWCLNGTKSFVVNAAGSNLLLVLAQTEINDRQGDKKESQTVFIVDGSLPGIKVHGNHKTIGSLQHAQVTFKDVILSKDSVLSIPGAGGYIEKRTRMNSRLHQGLLNLTQMKLIVQYILSMIELIEKETATESDDNEAKTLRSVVGKYVCSIYTIESMLYLTTGIMDKYENTNIDLETAIFKTYSQDQLMNLMGDLMSFVDTRVTLDSHPLNNLIRNAIQLKYGEPKDAIKLHIGQEGIRHRMTRFINEVVVKKNTDFVIKNFIPDQHVNMYDAALHSSANSLFKSIEHLRLGTSTLVEYETRDLPKHHIEIQKLADAAACIYGSYACLLRCDRALKTKLPNASEEIFIVENICLTNKIRVKELMQYVDDGPQKTFEKYHDYLSQLLMKKEFFNSNFPAHPLTRLY